MSVDRSANVDSTPLRTTNPARPTNAIAKATGIPNINRKISKPIQMRPMVSGVIYPTYHPFAR